MTIDLSCTPSMTLPVAPRGLTLMVRIQALLCLALFALTGTVTAQAAWTMIPPPPQRMGHAMGTDTFHGSVVLFGGYSPQNTVGPDYGDTWIWTNSGWTRANPSTTPPARSWHAMAGPTANGGVLLFGGKRTNTTQYFADTWEWNGSNWVSMQPNNTPPARFQHAMAMDPTTNRILLFGGVIAGTPSTFLSDTWAWDGVNWNMLAPANSPPARGSHAMATDLAHSDVLLFGGTTASQDLADTWVWNGFDWQQLQPSVSPSARLDHVMASSPSTASVVLFSGRTSSNITGLNDTWAWDGANWTLLSTTTAPSNGRRPAMATIGTGTGLVLFGGTSNRQQVFLNETWAFDGTSWTEEYINPMGR